MGVRKRSVTTVYQLFLINIIYILLLLFILLYILCIPICQMGVVRDNEGTTN